MQWTTLEAPSAPTFVLGSVQGPFREPQYHPQCTHVDFPLVFVMFVHVPNTRRKHPHSHQIASQNTHMTPTWPQVTPNDSQLTSR